MSLVMNDKKKMLVGNSFPLSLVRGGEVRMTCPSLCELQKLVRDSEVVSYWGHENTRSVAEAVLGASLKPKIRLAVRHLKANRSTPAGCFRLTM